MKKLTIAAALILFGALIFIPGLKAWAYPVPELPSDNLIENPWFRSAADPNKAGLDGWTNITAGGVGWGLSQKEDNPSPEMLVGKGCAYKAAYCGTAARWANEADQGGTQSYPGVDVYLSQVVSTNSSHRRLNFSMYWANHKLEVAEAMVYGANAPNGPWNFVWRPISISQDVNPPQCCVPGQNGNPWFKTGTLQTTLNSGYPYYKIVLHARYPEADSDQGDVGVKITGVYFTSKSTTDPASLSTPVVVYNPAIGPGDATQPATEPAARQTVTPAPTNTPPPAPTDPRGETTRTRP